VDAALRELRSHAGTQFCPRVIDALLEIRRQEPHVLASEAAGRAVLIAVPGAA
jgi:HD-GYP domain-containing protein (c-di-GMP phosphodiesterase class II)